MFYDGAFYGDEEVQAVTYWIPERNLPELQDKLDKLVSKAQRLGVGAISYAVGEPESRPYVRYQTPEGVRYEPYKEPKPGQPPVDPADTVYFRFFPVSVTGTTPRLAGWSFVATLQHLTDDGGNTVNMLRIVPGFTDRLPDKYRTADASNCDHCGRHIRTRKDTFVLRHDETGEYKQVGRNCTQDFLGGKDPHAVAQFMEYLFHALATAGEAGEEGFGFGGRAEETYGALAFLTQVAAVVRVLGWVSRGKAREARERQEYLDATADVVLRVLGPPPTHRDAYESWRELKEKVEPTETDKLTAEKALDYARDVLANKPDLDDYEHNLYVALGQPSIGHRLAGIAASLIPYYLRAVERLVEHQRAAESQHFGVEGERDDYYFTLLKVIPIDSMYGTTYLHRFLTREGNAVTWFASGSQGLDVGVEYRVTATIKKHDEYKGVKQTVVTRVTVYTDEGRAEAEAKEARKVEREAKRAAAAAAKAERAAAREAKAAAKAAKAAAAGEPVAGWEGTLPSDVAEYYVEGAPDVFAVAVYEEYGFVPLAVVGYYYDRHGRVNSETAHVAVGLPDGRVADASGSMTIQEMLDLRWMFEHDVFNVDIVPIPVEEAAETFGPPPRRAEIDQAREHARLLFG